MLFFIVLISLIFFLFLFFSVSPGGLVDFRMGFLLKAAKLLEARNGTKNLHELASRRSKTIADIAFVSRKYRGVQVHDTIAAGSVPVRFYSIENDLHRPLIVYFHGGGYVLGDLGYADNICMALVLKTGALVVSVDYRLAPEHVFPSALEDAEATVEWILQRANNGTPAGYDPKRIFVMGDSAGGNLAAALCLKLKESGQGTAIKGQILLYPVIDFSSMDTDSYNRYGKDYMLSKIDMEWFRDCYLSDPADRKNPFVSVSLADDLSSLPDALIFTAEYDALRDEGKLYADLLQKAGNKVSHILMKSLTHGFLAMDAYLPQTNRVYAEVKAFIQG